MDVSASDRHRATQPVIEHYTELGFNFRMTDIQAAVGLVQLRKMGELVARRRQLAERYHRLLSCIPRLLAIQDPDYGTTNYQSFWVLLPDESPVTRNELLGILAQAGVSARRGIMATHLEPAYANHPHGSLPVTERVTARSLILPLFHQMSEAEQDVVATTVVDSQFNPQLASHQPRKHSVAPIESGRT
jgi:perosamine synthetase